MKNLLINEIYPVLQRAVDGNWVSATIFNEWSEKNGLPSLQSGAYKDVRCYDDFYNVVYYYTFID